MLYYDNKIKQSIFSFYNNILVIKYIIRVPERQVYLGATLSMYFYSKYDKIFFMNKGFNKIINYISSFLTLKLNVILYN
jgi:hypothetical protein